MELAAPSEEAPGSPGPGQPGFTAATDAAEAAVASKRPAAAAGLPPWARAAAAMRAQRLRFFDELDDEPASVPVTVADRLREFTSCIDHIVLGLMNHKSSYGNLWQLG